MDSMPAIRLFRRKNVRSEFMRRHVCQLRQLRGMPGCNSLLAPFADVPVGHAQGARGCGCAADQVDSGVCLFECVLIVHSRIL